MQKPAILVLWFLELPDSVVWNRAILAKIALKWLLERLNHISLLLKCFVFRTEASAKRE